MLYEDEKENYSLIKQNLICFSLLNLIMDILYIRNFSFCDSILFAFFSKKIKNL